MGPVREALERGTHFGASHETIAEWAGRVCDLVPSAEMVRFHSSGTEATMMAMRICRALTGRERVLKFEGHFHGWHDYATVAVNEPFDVPTSAGVPGTVQELVTAIPVNDAGAGARYAGGGRLRLCDPGAVGGGGRNDADRGGVGAGVAGDMHGDGSAADFR